ncbi:hypothetical protein ASNO1_44490 [Corallococcus caeni]|uniref:Transposase n=1 Tax=Corallococcus caeni TaxID=3082388 RepID=A0ABQ6QWM6_9BACT|nr:hypothetical protein ASNO1_44490 [Corallococcus sp. NO1]
MAVMGQAQSAGLTSSEHFSVDGSLIEAWASLKSFRPKDDKQEPPDDKVENAGHEKPGLMPSNRASSTAC